MFIDEPKAMVIVQEDPIEHVARCARICTASKATDDKRTYNRLIKDKHWSMFRHEAVYAIIKNAPTSDYFMMPYKFCPYIDCHIENRGDYYDFYISTNMNFMMDIRTVDKAMYDIIMNHRVTPKMFFSNLSYTYKLFRITVLCQTQISISREFNRVSPNAISEQSTRYVDESGVIVRPHWMPKSKLQIIPDSSYYGYMTACDFAFDTYLKMVNKGVPKEDARGVLPLDTRTMVIYTYTIKDWVRILANRYYGATGKPHPNAKVLAKCIMDAIEDTYPGTWDFDKLCEDYINQLKRKQYETID